MKHLSCGLGRPFGARVFRSRFQGHMVCHCLLLEDGGRLVLIDAGLSEKELERPGRLGVFARGLGLVADPTLAAKRQLEAQGLDPCAVTDVVVTHLDLDHAGGLLDFPEARVHVHAAELAAARAPRGVTERLRYRSQQWRHAHFVPHEPHGDMDPGNAAPVVSVGDWKVSLIPLFGHTRGHCGILVRSEQRAVLHVGDTYYDASELEDRGSLLFRCFRSSVDQNGAAARESRQRVVEWKQRWPELTVVSSHDPSEFEAARALGNLG